MTNTPLARRPRHRSVRVAARRLLLAALGSATGTALAGTLSVTTPGAGSWTVPDGVTQIGIVAVGGGGGSGFWNTSGRRGGHGARIELDAIAVTPGQVISYFVGGGGGPSNIHAEQGSGGGGSTNVRFDAASNPALIAGGGGGGAVFNVGGDACPANRNGGFGGAGVQSMGGIAGPGTVDQLDRRTLGDLFGLAAEQQRAEQRAHPQSPGGHGPANVARPADPADTGGAS